MKIMGLLSALLMLGLSACSSKVVTYDAAGNLIGSCKATKGLLSTAHASCHGSGDALGVNYHKMDEKTGLMPALPKHSQITLR